MPPLTIRDFSRFFEALHSTPDRRVAPFPWQRRLIEAVDDEGWPEVLDLPTGTGKTSVLEVAVFHLALEASRSDKQRRAPRRIVMIVDRRTVVDQAYERGNFIAQRLNLAADGVLLRVASALRSLAPPHAGAGAPAPLAASVLRGGMYRDDAWARRPDQPLIVASTVDQVGSRLVFRGYGVSDSMRPVHAGLLSNDALLFLDEVHLSRPFDETLEALKGYREWAAERLASPWHVVRLSATPGVFGERRAFSLDDEDRRDAVLARRLAAHKPARLRLVSTRGEEDEKRQAFAKECAKEAIALLEAACRTVAVVVNRVDAARRVYELLSSANHVGQRNDVEPEGRREVVLMTGRMRPFDRDVLVNRLRPRILAGRTRSEAERPLVLVATQCIEAGADFDFDGLVTECASLDALRQRFGRLDRLGDFGRARAVILARKDGIEGEEPDPVYGMALRRTWEWLSGKSEWDFGIDHLKLPKVADRLKMLSARGEDADDRRDRSPVMLPAHLDAWVQTSPRPAVEPDVGLWLHGLSGIPADVQVIWRADIDQEDLTEPDGDEQAKNWLAVSPPASAEALGVPFYAVVDWLRQESPRDVADVEGESSPEERQTGRTQAARNVIRWRGDDTKVVPGNDIRPGDTIVVPLTYGGLGTHRNWDASAMPASSEVGLDIGDLVQQQQRGRAVLRLHPEVLRNLGLPQPPALPADAGPMDVREILTDWLDVIQPQGTSPELSASVSELLNSLRRRPNGRVGWRAVTVDVAGTDSLLSRMALVGQGVAQRGEKAGIEADDVSTEPDVSSFTAAPVSLERHSRGVQGWARHLARQCGLPEELVEDLALAGWLHDVGKADPRFQTLLRGGSEIDVAMGDALLAKSSLHSRDRASRERARKLSRYPKGTRHEMLSVALVQGQPDLAGKAHDWELVLHLIASHHGFGRPFAPPLKDPDDLGISLQHDDVGLTAAARHDLARLDSPVPDRFWRVVQKYGWFGLAWLEAILRLADHRCSEHETRGQEEA